MGLMRCTTLVSAAAAVGVAISCLRVVDAKCSSSMSDPEVSWDSAKKRLYLTKGCATMTDLVELRKDDNGHDMGPVFHFSKGNNWYTTRHTGTYYLEADLHIINGATLSIDGDESDTEECDTLYLASNSSTRINLRAHGGKLDIRNTQIYSWDLKAGDYDTEPEKNGRSYINAITEIITGRTKDTCPDVSGDNTGRAKQNMGTATMNIYRSEIGYLGYQATEAYGISYKARGLCDDHSNLDIYDDDQSTRVGTKGEIKESKLHDNWFGQYSWGHDGGTWKNNKVYNNYGYGFDPHDDSDNISIVDNEVYNNGWHGIIASKRCNDVTIEGNQVYNNGYAGIMLHRSSDYATVKNNHVYNNGDAGIAFFESSYIRAYGNTLKHNTYGVRFSNGSNNNKVYENVIRVGTSNKYAVLTYKGTDPQEADDNDDGYNRYNEFHRNTIHSSQKRIWKIKEAESNSFRSNTIYTGGYATFTYSEENSIKYNTFPTDFYFDTGVNTCYARGSQAEPIC